MRLFYYTQKIIQINCKIILHISKVVVYLFMLIKANLKNVIMKTLKIASGYYKFDYKGFEVNIKNRAGDMTGVDGWYFTYIDLNGNFNGAEDIHRTKGIAIEAAIEWIDYLMSKVA